MMTKTVITTIAIGLLFGCGPSVEERATINTDGSAADVNAKIVAANNGDTIKIPNGTYTWTTTVNLNKPVTLQGGGIGNTIIKDAVQGSPLIKVTLTASSLTRITGIEIQDGGRTNFFYGILNIMGSTTNGAQYRMDNCKLININGIQEIDTVIGVIDHNNIVTDNGASPPWHVHGSKWGGSDYGDGSWVEPVVWGSSKFLFIEDNTFSHTSGTQSMIDGDAGARWVIRYNTFNGAYEVDNHGTESTGRPRGCRAMEIYNNRFNSDGSNRFLGGSRSGGVLFYNNSIKGYWGALAAYGLNNFRSVHAYSPWGGADGTNPWDKNVTPAAFTGTAAAASSGQSVTVSGANWTANQFAGYTLRRTTTNSSLPYTVINSNTSNRLDYVNNVIYGGETATTFAAGDGLEIRKVDLALDQPGAGAVTSTISGGYSPIVPSGWNQVVEPCYSWNNIDEQGNRINFGPNFPSIRKGVHFFDETPKPGYTPYTYPHPLVTGGGTPAPTTPPSGSPTATPTALPTATAAATPSPTAGASSISQSIVNGSTVSGSVEWTATVVNAAAVIQVKFFIDGAEKWTENTAPYFYGGDFNKLDTKTLPDGAHKFRVTSFDAGQNVVATNEVNATVANNAPTPSPTHTPTATPTATATATPTATPTSTPAPTSTPTPQPTLTPTPTATPTVTSSPSPVPTPAVIILQPGQSVLITAPTPPP